MVVYRQRLSSGARRDRTAKSRPPSRPPVYEMVTGKKAFEGKSQASLIGAIMSSGPKAMAQLQPMSPPALDRVVKRSLAKVPDERWQSGLDLCQELKWIRRDCPPSRSSRTGRLKRRNDARATTLFGGNSSALLFVTRIGGALQGVNSQAYVM